MFSAQSTFAQNAPEAAPSDTMKHEDNDMKHAYNPDKTIAGTSHCGDFAQCPSQTTADLFDNTNSDPGNDIELAPVPNSDSEKTN